MRDLEAPVVAGAGLVVLGVLWLLRNLGVIATLPIGPVLLITLGAFVLLTALREWPEQRTRTEARVWEAATASGGGPSGATAAGSQPGQETQLLSLPVDGAVRARLILNHGAGTLRIRAGAPDGPLYELRTDGPAEQRLHRSGDRVDITLRPSEVASQISRAAPVVWDLLLSPAVLLDLEIRTGAAKVDADLAGLTVERCTVKSGASDLVLALPDRGWTRTTVSAGAADVRIRVPDGVAATIRNRSALASVHIDEHRFPRSNGVHRSVDFDSADVRAEIELEGGVASFQVR
jgi:hypothetical protein